MLNRTNNEVSQGFALFEEGKFLEAVQAFTESLQHAQTAEEIHKIRLYRGRAYLALGNINFASTEFLACYSIGPIQFERASWALFYDGLCLQILGRHAEANQAYEDSLFISQKDDQLNFYIYFNSGLLLKDQCNFKLAHDYFRHALTVNYRKDPQHSALARIFLNVCLFHLKQDEAIKYFSSDYDKDYAILTEKQPTPFYSHTLLFSTLLKTAQNDVQQVYFANGISELEKGELKKALATFQAPQLTGAPRAQAYILYVSGLQALAQNNAYAAKELISKAVCSTVSHGEIESFALFKTHMLHCLIQLRKLNLNVSLKGYMHEINERKPKTFTDVCLLLIAASSPNQLNKTIFIECLRQFLTFSMTDIPKFLVEDLVLSLVQPHIKMYTHLAFELFPNLALTKKDLVELLIHLNNVALKQTALLQALLPQTVLGAIFHVPQGKLAFHPTVATSSNKRKIMACLLQDIKNHGNQISQETQKLFAESTPLQREIEYHSPELYRLMTSSPSMVNEVKPSQSTPRLGSK